MFDSLFGKNRYRGNDDDNGRPANIYADHSRRDAFDPNVFSRPTPISPTILYRYALNIPYFGQRVGAGHINSPALPASRAAAGDLTSYIDPNTGNRIFVVAWKAWPQDV